MEQPELKTGVHMGYQGAVGQGLKYCAIVLAQEVVESSLSTGVTWEMPSLILPLTMQNGKMRSAHWFPSS